MQVSNPRTAPTRMDAWLLAVRLPTLSAAVVPVLVGSAFAWALGAFHLPAFLVALIAAMLIQIGTNLANDYFDAQKGADTAARIGPPRVTQLGLIPAETVRRGMIVTFGLAALAGLYLVWLGGWPILAIGLASIAAGVLYTGGPWPLGYHGLGDLTVFVFFGVIAVVGMAYVQTGQFSGGALVVSLPVACLVTAILVVNNLRDIDTDRVAGKRTLAVLLGSQGTRFEYLALVVVAYLVPLVRWLIGAQSGWFWLPWLTASLAFGLVKLVLTADGPVLNQGLRQTSQLHLIFGVLFAASLLL